MKDFIIQCNMLSNDLLGQVKEAVVDLPHMFVGLMPFTHEITSNERIIGRDHIPYGSTSFVETALELGWEGLSFDLNKFNYAVACASRDDMLNAGLILPAIDAAKYLNSLKSVEHVTSQTYIFMRPAHDLKQFAGSLFAIQEAIDFIQDALNCSSSGYYKISEDLPIVLSSPKNILVEWRWFIIDGRVIDGSIYRRNGQINKRHIDDPASYFIAQGLANKWLPDECCVMDTCLLDDGSLKVVEFNCINGSGFYDHDVKLIMTEWWRYWNEEEYEQN